MDKLLSLLPRFGFRTSVFFKGEFCGNTQFLASEGMGHLHLVRRGPVVMEHPDLPPIEITVPTLVFYPRPFDHQLVVPPDNLASLLCANVSFNDAVRNPIALALPDVLLIPLDEESGLSPTLALLFVEAAEDDVGKRLVMDHLCDILVVHLIRYARRMNLIKTGVLAGLSDTQIAPVLIALHTNAGHPWCIEEMASLANLSRTGFVNRFRAIVGMPPAEYLTNWRMDLAKTYLLQGRSVKEIALDVGYSFQPAFTKAFSSKVGVSPTEWLKQASQAY